MPKIQKMFDPITSDVDSWENQRRREDETLRSGSLRGILHHADALRLAAVSLERYANQLISLPDYDTEAEEAVAIAKVKLEKALSVVQDVQSKFAELKTGGLK